LEISHTTIRMQAHSSAVPSRKCSWGRI
jgi:hypothetical protein